ncbi:M10 family metallopeptidase C-terminal domain-containing protein [Azospirillum halopraeferens]|uniref:M10 family metallopeptidase C-terminal domain-containing protein n=1 Tax=Azospirillum halopraeferens TaxID=34010 RepID=UPI00041A7E25|nr:M10 family metallopeptidase C-terminal domain-containing protein [Azospirillum halopraeferens]
MAIPVVETNLSTSTIIALTGKSGNMFIDSLLEGTKWKVSTLTYTFPTAGADWTGYNPADPDANHPFNGFVQLTADQQAAVVTALQSWANVANLNFVALPSSASTAHLRFSGSNTPQTAEAALPSAGDPTGGDVWFGPNDYNTALWQPRGEVYWGAVHEIGHALGLKHPHEPAGDLSLGGGVLPAHLDSMDVTVMSYRSYPGGSATDGLTIAEGSYPMGPMVYDVAAIQWMYGANYSYNGADTVYTFSPGTAKIFETVWDGGGIDTYDLSAYGTNLVVNLAPGAWSIFSTAQLADLGNGFLARGNVVNALLHNGDTRSLIENAIGGTGNDSITGNEATNTLFGGFGNDTLSGVGGDDVLYGNQGSDALYGNLGNDTLFGGQGDDFLFGGLGHDVLYGQIAADVVYGGAGHDTLFGGQGNDTLLGEDGDDWIYGNRGDDVMTGGSGADRFVCTGESGNDIITDFNAAEGDRVVISAGTAYATANTVDGLVIVLGGGHSVKLLGQNIAQFSDAWLAFA